MTGDVVNLRLARKAKARAEATSTAAANRVRFGRTKSERAADVREAERLGATLAGARRDRTDGLA